MIIAVYSPKGGVGKTTIALALATTAKRKTCAVEFDFSPGDFVSILDLERQRNIVEAVEGRLDYAIQKPKGKNYDVIVGGYPDTYERITQENLRWLLEELEKRYDVVIVDVQPGFVEGCIDVFAMAEKILLVVEDDYSVNSRLIGNVDWARVNGFIDTSKISLIVNKTRGRLRYVNITDLKFPVLYELPYIRNIKPFNDKRVYKHADRIWRKLLPEDYAEKRRFFFAPKPKQSGSPKTQPDTQKPAEENENTKIPQTEQTAERSEEILTAEQDILSENNPVLGEETGEMKGDGVPMGFYVNTGYEQLDNEIRQKIADAGGTGDTGSVAVVSSILYAERFLNEGRRVIFLAKGAGDAAKARALGVKDVFVNPFDLNEIVKAACGELPQESIKTAESEKKGTDEQAYEMLHEDKKEKDDTDGVRHKDDSEGSGAYSDSMDNAVVKEKLHQGEKEVVYGMETDIYGEIRNIIQKYLIEYERKLDEYEATIAQLKEQIREKDGEIEKYKQKTEKFSRLFSELQGLMGD
ncbi:MinD-like ATPase involved in chromosome partitioning or flagellar assembly [Caldanaerobius fijiensis DSM 17918]|uniref:MinD-like ATPase involved in chromosome partitioning or flagellar assembly n=1 Tax=Caldanaerobius fijiensis DSM 17918 TaxID=1121256 RepID=A0A1M5BJ46_9THEO|nr:AAA family ATPase [Caldanaerobius fijiensis]SHF42448.1 MinD-like ATPase involved in chromosome partitioning or flagellar assembly [Caldanaerobius fijiensis DSM 17918]